VRLTTADGEMRLRRARAKSRVRGWWCAMVLRVETIVCDGIIRVVCEGLVGVSRGAQRAR
jgi:hypothetical protein